MARSLCRVSGFHSRRARSALLLVVVAVLITSLTGLTGCRSTNDSATAAVNRLEGTALTLTPVGTQDYLAGKVERFSSTFPSGNTVDYYYDSAAARIVRKDDFSPVQGEVTVGMQQARASAEEFARSQVPFFQTSDLTLSQSVDAASNQSLPGVYSFTWTKIDPSSGALLPTFLMIDVEGSSGTVKSFNSVDTVVTISTNPLVSKEEAVAATRTAFPNIAQGATAESLLLVGTDPPGDPSGRQALLWLVTISTTPAGGGIQGGQAYIDATSGRVLRADQLL
jgi:hypothetical protein